ncbi:MAG: hypothetical protein LBI06_06655, partial [Treponema sp.]|nr:hypothetical protein [Treponema sp.]
MKQFWIFIVVFFVGGLFAANAQDFTDGAGSYGGTGIIEESVQALLNAMPAIPIAGNNLKFEFRGRNWTATVNGENFSAGTVELEETEGGYMLTLQQTHIWPGAVGRTAGRLASRIPGGGAVGGILNTAGNIA